MSFAEIGTQITGLETTVFLSARSVLKLYEVNEQYMRLAHLIAELMKGCYYGDLEIKFKDGKIVSCFKKESLII